MTLILYTCCPAVILLPICRPQKTDLLVTWLYKLTIDKQYYNIDAVIGFLTFVILAVAALLTYRNTKSYKEEGGF